MSQPDQIDALLSRILILAKNLGLPLTTLCHFGSSRYDPESKDIDILIAFATPAGATTYNYQKELEAIEARMKGDFSIPPAKDPFADVRVASFLQRLRDLSPFPIEEAFGPATPDPRGDLQARIHLNGPVTDRFLHLYGERFPIHSWVIRNNSKCYLGDPPPAGTITATELFHYIELMKDRMNSSSPFLVAKKALQTIGLLSGEKSCMPPECVSHAFTSSNPFRITIEKALQDERISTLGAESLLELLFLWARLMQESGTRYPESWSTSQ